MESLSQNLTYGGDRLQLFNVGQPLTFSILDFEARWKEVDNVWVQFGATKALKKDPNGWTKTYDCRFKKRHASSSKKADIPAEKRRKTSQRDASLCEAQITVTLRGEVVTIRKTRLDGPDHTHDLVASDVRKAPTAIISFVEQEAHKGYRAPAIKDAANDRFKDKASGVEYLPLKTVINAQRKVRGGLNAPFIGANDLEVDLKDSFEWLKSKGYQVEGFEKSDYRGFAFATEESLKALRKSGHLAIMDSTHKSNKHSWKLYTLLVRDSFGSWLLGGHFFVSAEEQDIVAMGFDLATTIFSH
jgi:hypothetical protein